MDILRDFKKGLLNIKAEFISRFTTAQQAKKHHKFALLQKDLWALILLIENGFDPDRYSWDTTDMYNVAQDFIRQTGACTDIDFTTDTRISVELFQDELIKFFKFNATFLRTDLSKNLIIILKVNIIYFQTFFLKLIFNKW
mgnify:CR=1 FL=1